MSKFILIDENNIVKDMASLEINLCPIKLGLYEKPIEVPDTLALRYGDEYNPASKEIIKRPENYPVKVYTEAEQIEMKIHSEMRSLAVANLKSRGEIPQDFETAPVTRTI